MKMLYLIETKNYTAIQRREVSVNQINKEFTLFKCHIILIANLLIIIILKIRKKSMNFLICLQKNIVIVKKILSNI